MYASSIKKAVMEAQPLYELQKEEGCQWWAVDGIFVFGVHCASSEDPIVRGWTLHTWAPAMQQAKGIVILK